jgi:oligopeptide/dipeptide ABC transporter ATP-binding protein
MLLQVDGLKKYFKVGGKPLRAVDGVSFTVDRGDIFGIVGESGSGKTTIGRCLLGLEHATEGQVLYEGEDLHKLRHRQMKEVRPKMQMVFQNPYSSFNPAMTIGQSLRELGSVYRLGRKETLDRIAVLLEKTGLYADVLQRKPKELSGGQLQRLAITRALILRPALIVADEPVSALDVSVQAQVINLLLELKEAYQLTMLLISHDLTVVEHICNRVAVVYLGKIVEIASAATLFNEAAHPYTQALISAKPKEHPSDTTNRILLKTALSSAISPPPGCVFSAQCHRCAGICREKQPELKELAPHHFVACHFINIEKEILP